MACPEVWARMAILNKKLKEAEAIYLEQNQLDEALNMYQEFHKWDEGSMLTLYLKLSAPCTTSVVNAIVYLSYLFNFCNKILCGGCIHHKSKVLIWNLLVMLNL